MTFDQFAPPFLLLQSHFEQRPRDPDDERLFRLSWFRVMEPISVQAWEAAVDRWIATQKWMPKPVEMRETCYEEATRLVHEREEQERQERLRLAPPADPARQAELQERMRRLKASLVRLAPPAPSDAPPPLPGDDR